MCIDVNKSARTPPPAPQAALFVCSADGGNPEQNTRRNEAPLLDTSAHN